MVLMNLATPDLQVRSRATDIENGPGDATGRRRWDESRALTYLHTTVCKIAS